MKKFLFVLGLLSLSLLQAQDKAPEAMYNNGVVWKVFKTDQKVAWLYGYKAGLENGALDMAQMTGADFTKKYKLYIPSNAVPAAIVKSVDAFYSDPDNIVVSIPNAVSVVALIQSGKSPSDVANLVKVFREAGQQALKK